MRAAAVMMELLRSEGARYIARQSLGDGRVGDVQALKRQTAVWNKK
jgi:ribosomal protein S28E/S33